MYWLCLLKAHNHPWERLAMFAYGKSETTSTAANIFTTYTQEGSGTDEKKMSENSCLQTNLCYYGDHDALCWLVTWLLSTSNPFREVLALLRAWFVSSTSVTSSLRLCKEAPELWTEVIYIFRTYMQLTKMIPKWKPIWSGMILLLSKMIVSVADDRVLSDPSLHSFSYHERLMYTTFWIFLFFSIFARSEYFLALWHAMHSCSIHGWWHQFLASPRVHIFRFLGFDFQLFQMHMHFLISIDSYFFKYSKHISNIIAVILRTHTYV